MECLERLSDRGRSSSLRWRPALTAGNYIAAGRNVNSIVARAPCQGIAIADPLSCANVFVMAAGSPEGML